MSGFIPTKTSTAWDIGPIERFFVGDNRDFSSNSPRNASRFWVWINADTGEFAQRFIQPTQRTSAANGEPIGEPFPPRNNPADDTIIGWFQGSNDLEAKFNDDCSITFDYSVVCSDPACNILLAPNGSITFSPNDLGSYDVSGIVNKFPNLEAYHWQAGELQGDYLFRIQNFSSQEIASGNANMTTSFGMFLPVDLSEVYGP